MIIKSIFATLASWCIQQSLSLYACHSICTHVESNSWAPQAQWFFLQVQKPSLVIPALQTKILPVWEYFHHAFCISRELPAHVLWKKLGAKYLKQGANLWVKYNISHNHALWFDGVAEEFGSFNKMLRSVSQDRMFQHDTVSFSHFLVCAKTHS